MKRPETSRFPQSYLCIAFLLFVGYVLIVVSILFGAGNQSATNVSGLLMQAEIAQRDLVAAQSEIRKLKLEQRSAVSSTGTGATDSHHVVLTRSKVNSDASPPAIRPGVIILGMHRSGTSLLGGLMNKMGLQTGPSNLLIQPAEDNPKGFFERVDVVLQDDALMARQGVHYSHNTYKYNALTGLKHALTEMEDPDSKWFNEGKRGLAFLNNPQSYPWMLKDPRLCITLRTWLPLLNFVPAVLFTYRHPMDVALSMNKRGFEHFKVNKGLRIWYSYNKRAVEQSDDLCRIVTSHRKVMKQPDVELARIYQELHDCGVAAPKMPSSADIAAFVDSSLQHGRSSLTKESICEQDIASLPSPESWPTTEQGHLDLYRECIRVYCAMEDGSAFRPGFQWSKSVKDDQ